MSAIQIKKTGNFWIDNGLVGLYRVLESLQSKEVLNDNGNRIDFKVILNSTSLEIKLSGDISNDKPSVHPDLIKVLNEAKKDVTNRYLIETKNFGWIFKNGNFKAYQKADYSMFIKPFFKGMTGKPEEGTLIVPYNPTTIKKYLLDNKESFEEKEDGGFTLLASEKRKVAIPKSKKKDLGSDKKIRQGINREMDEVEFLNFIHFIKENNSIKFAGKGYFNSPPKYSVGKELIADFDKAGKNTCFFSGIKSKVNYEIGLDYPFLTGGQGELNFSSFLKEKPTISARYAFVAFFSFYNLHYQIKKDLQNYFIFYDTNLKELNSFYNAIQPSVSQLKNADYCNFETYIIGTEYENETLFGFIVSVYKQAKQKLAKDARKELYTKSIFTFTNDGNIFRDVKEYTSLTQLFELFDSFDETEDEKFGFESFLNLVRYFYKTIPSKPKPKYDTTWRNRLCADILNFRSIAKTVEWFLGEVRLKEETPSGIFYLDKILHVYNNKTQFDMKPEMVEMCKSVGNRIGRYCREKDDKGILFSIRNAKNRTEFLNVLSESQFRTEVSYGEDFFKALPDTPAWEEYKALVSIFAMNSFLYKPNNPNNS